MGNEEKRQSQRLEFQAPAFIQHEQGTVYGEVKNLSHHGGLFVSTRTRVQVTDDETLLVSLYFTEAGATLSVTVPATIVHHGEQGYGLRAPQVNLHSLLYFEYLMSSSRGDAQQLMHDFYAYISSSDEGFSFLLGRSASGA
jgi:hypothetical protein